MRRRSQTASAVNDRCVDNRIFVSGLRIANDGVAVMVKASELPSKGRGFDSRRFHFHVTTLGNLFAHKHVLLPGSRVQTYGSVTIVIAIQL